MTPVALPMTSAAQRGQEATLLQGSSVLAQALVAAGCEFGTGYPGSPMIGALEEFRRLAEERSLLCRYGMNEKIALEMAAAASFAGKRAVCIMKHAGLLVALDPATCVSYTGVKGGLVLAVGDDPGCESSGTETDSRVAARLLGFPCFQPHSVDDIFETTLAAMELSEKVGHPVILRLTPDLCHSATFLDFDPGPALSAERRTPDPPRRMGQRFLLAPGNAQALHRAALGRIELIRQAIELSPLNREHHPAVQSPAGSRTGYVVDGACLESFLAAQERLGLDLPYFSPALTWPLPHEAALRFAANYERVVVVEALEPVIEEQLATKSARAGHDVRILGKEIFPTDGNLDEHVLCEHLARLEEREAPVRLSVDSDIVAARPPTFCPGCPHTAFFYSFKEFLESQPDTPFVGSDVGCYAMGAKAGIRVGHSILCMGSGLGLATGMALVGTPSVAIIGDSTFLHAGLPALVNAVESRVDLLLCILDNSAAAMTGGQATLSSSATEDRIYALALATGAASVKIVTPFETQQLQRTLQTSFEEKGVAVVIVRSPCALLSRPSKRRVQVNDRCSGSADCVTKIHCPALRLSSGKAVVDLSACVGCGLCVDICPDKALEWTS